MVGLRIQTRNYKGLLYNRS